MLAFISNSSADKQASSPSHRHASLLSLTVLGLRVVGRCRVVRRGFFLFLFRRVVVDRLVVFLLRRFGPRPFVRARGPRGVSLFTYRRAAFLVVARRTGIRANSLLGRAARARQGLGTGPPSSPRRSRAGRGAGSSARTSATTAAATAAATATATAATGAATGAAVGAIPGPMAVFSAAEAGVVSLLSSGTSGSFGPFHSDSSPQQTGPVQISYGVFGISLVFVFDETVPNLDVTTNDSAVFVEEVLQVTWPCVVGKSS